MTAMSKPTTSDSETFDETREKIHREMLSAVSHDLKTPLATVIGSLEIYTRMGAKISEEKRVQLIASALSEAYRLDKFITNILDMAKLEGGMVKIKNERSDLRSLLEDALIRLGPKREKGEISVVPCNEHTIVFTDPMLLSRAIGLVLDNALRHGGKQPKVIIEYSCDDSVETSFVRVRDHGPGIPEGKEEEIFSKYTRLARADQQNAGTGLGLAICRRIMQVMGGSVSVRNHPDGGAEFTLRFPSNK
jgi:K+-sensing histidine kinase KdpD